MTIEAPQGPANPSCAAAVREAAAGNADTVRDAGPQARRTDGRTDRNLRTHWCLDRNFLVS